MPDSRDKRATALGVFNFSVPLRLNPASLSSTERFRRACLELYSRLTLPLTTVSSGLASPEEQMSTIRLVLVEIKETSRGAPFIWGQDAYGAGKVWD